MTEYGLRATLLDSNQGQTTLQAIAAADLAITKSGTVNLEMALLDVPQVVLYRVNRVTAWIAQKILRVSIPFMSPPNLVEMKPIVPEFLQDEATVENIVEEAIALLQPDRRQKNARQTIKKCVKPSEKWESAIGPLKKF